MLTAAIKYDSALSKKIWFKNISIGDIIIYISY